MRTPNECDCLFLDSGEMKREWSELKLHLELQNTNGDAWKYLLELVEEAAKDCREEFAPGREMKSEHWNQIITLPRSIAKLKHVKRFSLLGSNIVRIPPEIGEMTALEYFEPYTSYQLHWFPFELTRCRKLKSSCVSTRSLYGNYKFRPPFPRLPFVANEITPASCSVCNAEQGVFEPIQYWISLRVGTDVLPLLVHACSEECGRNLRQSAEGYIKGPHRGGLELAQPECRFSRAEMMHWEARNDEFST